MLQQSSYALQLHEEHKARQARYRQQSFIVRAKPAPKALQVQPDPEPTAQEIIKGLQAKIAVLTGELGEARKKLSSAEKALSISTNPQMKRILAVVADHFGVDEMDIVWIRRTQELSIPRHLLMYLGRMTTNLTFSQIGSIVYSRDPTTIQHGVRKIKQMMAADPSFRAEVEALREAVTQDE